MKKLKNKVFATILILLTFFSLSILIVVNYQSYQKEKVNIETNLKSIGNAYLDSNIPNDNQKEDKIDSNNEATKKTITNQDKVFMDIIAYTIIIDDNNNILSLSSHSVFEIDDDTYNKITTLAKEVLESINKKETKIECLYITNYSYYLSSNNILTVIDNTDTKTKLIKEIKESIIIFIILEIIIIYSSLIITKWITKPAIESFNKQKQFIADASHELKTPLSVIMASADALEEDKNEKWLKNIKSETNRMNNLISNLLNLASLEQEEEKKYYKEENISKIIEKQVLSFESLAYENNIKLKYKIEENITLNCNSEQIKQLVAILIDNAIAHSYKKETIKINLSKEKNDITLTVTNKGDIIPKSEQEKIFERFYRADKSRNRTQNRYGLGLAIAKNITNNHNGTIEVSSENNKTTFKVIFK